MKVSYIVALLMVVLMVGCATKAPPPAAPPAAAPPAAPPAAAPTTPPPAPAETPPAEGKETPPAVEGDIVVTGAGFDPAEITVKVGTTLAIKSAEGRHKLTVGAAVTPFIEEGTAYDVTFDKVGKIRVYDILSKKSAYVTVTEEAAEKAGAEGTTE